MLGCQLATAELDLFFSQKPVLEAFLIMTMMMMVRKAVTFARITGAHMHAGMAYTIDSIM